jgi:pilus assembly protein CpaE
VIIVTDPEQAFRSQVEKLVSETVGVVRHAAHLPAAEQLLEGRPGGDVEAVVLGPHLHTEEAVEAVRRLRKLDPAVGVVLVGEDVSAELLRASLRAGIQDVVPFPFTNGTLVEAVDLAREHSRQGHSQIDAPTSDAGAGDHRLVSVFSLKGGSGKTVVATNLATLIAQTTGEDVVLVDLDLQAGDVAIMMQLVPTRTIHDVAENLHRLDVDAVQGYLTPNDAGVLVLAAPADPSLADGVPPEAVKTILEMLRQSFRYVVVDCPSMFTEQVLVALDESDDCVLVSSLDVANVKNLRVALSTLQQLGLERSRTHVVLNRADSNVGLRREEVEKVIETEIDVAIPSHRDVPLSVNTGTPLAQTKPRSSVIQPLRELTRVLGAEAASTPGKSDRSRRFLKRR